MNDEQLRLLSILSAKEALLADIIIWLKTKRLFNECMSVVDPKLVEEQEIYWLGSLPQSCPVCKKPYKYFGKSKMMCDDPSTNPTGVKVEYCTCKRKP